MTDAPEPEAPIACTLSATNLADRKSEMSVLAATYLRDRAPLPSGERLVFEASTDAEADLERLVAAEADCCAFLTFDLSHRDDALVLDITGPKDALPLVQELFA